MKRNFTLIVLSICCASFSNAQDACYTFDEQVVPSNESQHIFNLYGDGAGGFLEDWYVTSGTPSIYQSGQLAGVDAFEGNQFVIAGVCDLNGDYSEGLSVSHNFEQGHSYTVSLAIRNAPLPPNQPTPIDLNFILLEDTIPFNYQFASGCTATPNVPAGSYTAHTITDLDLNSWQVVTFDIMNVSQDFGQLWFRTARSQGSPQITTFFLMDSLCITEILPSTCYTFDEQVVPSNESQHIFNLYGDGAGGFLEDWYVTSGTPSIYQSGQLAGVDAFEGNQYVIAGVCDLNGDYSEGLSVSYDFQQGHTYTVSLAIRNAPLPPNQPTPIDVQFVLLEDTIPFNYQFASGCTTTPSVPSGALTAYSVPSFATNAWTVVSFNTPSLAQDYSQLWFRNLRSQGSPQITTFFLMDSLCISEKMETSIKELSKPEALVLYPNPTTGTVTLNTGTLEGVMRLEVLNLMGQVVESRSVNAVSHSNVSLDLQHLAVGQYMIRLRSNEGQLIGRIVLQR